MSVLRRCGTYQLHHRYVTDGVYTVQVRVGDDERAIGIDQFTAQVGDGDGFVGHQSSGSRNPHWLGEFTPIDHPTPPDPKLPWLEDGGIGMKFDFVDKR